MASNLISESTKAVVPRSRAEAGRAPNVVVEYLHCDAPKVKERKGTPCYD
jgi:hypothetical protein